MSRDILAHRIITDAQIQAFNLPPVAPPPSGFNGGLVMGESDSDKKLRQTRYWAPVDRFSQDATYTRHLEGDYAYAGLTYSHFGHVMSEMVHRIVPSLKHRDNPNWLIVSTHGHPVNEWEKLSSWIKPIYSFLGLGPENVTILTENTTVSNLSVVEQGSDFGGGPKPGYLDLLAEYTHGRLDRLHKNDARPEKIYVSRSHLNAAGGILGERYLEQAFAREGFIIYRPEQDFLPVQMDHYRKAEIIIFGEGSACHGVELLGTDSLKQCIFINRRKSHFDIFRRVLQPRAAEFLAFSETRMLGSAAADPSNGAPMEHLGVSVFDLDALVEFFRSNGIARLEAISKSEYFAAAEADLFSYLEEQALKNLYFTRIEHVRDLLRSFHVAKAV